MVDIVTRRIQANGLEFEIDEAKGGDGTRLALCLHGFPESKFSWRYQLPLLAELGYLAWAPNLRGYGASSRPKDIAAYDIDKLVARGTAFTHASKAHVAGGKVDDGVVDASAAEAAVP